MKQLTKRSIEVTSDKYVQSMFLCRYTSTHRTESQNYARNLPHSSLNPMSPLHLLHSLAPLFHTSTNYESQLRTVPRHRTIFLAIIQVLIERRASCHLGL